MFEIRTGYTPEKKIKEYWTNGTVSHYRMDDIRTHGRILNSALQKVTKEAVKGGRLYKANSIIMATCATIGEHALITEDFLANRRFSVLTLKSQYKNDLDMKYFFYLCFLIDEWCKRNTNKSGFESVDMGKFRNLVIEIPSLSRQKEIVEILDKFDTLVNDISKGLPREIELRRKQYEYYRERLVSFC